MNPQSASLLLGTICLMTLAGCDRADPKPLAVQPEVIFINVAEQPVTLSSQLPARTSAYETSDVRPQVDGLVLARLFQEGDHVEAGQPLYRIDPAPYRTQEASAAASLRRAQAEIAATTGLARRYAELIKINAVAAQDLENAQMAANQSIADVAAQRAALNNARINLGRTVIKAPISGRIGRSAITTGALVSAAQPGALATIQRLDPIFIDVQQSSTDVLRLRRQLLAGQLASPGGIAHVRLIMEDGSPYPHLGALKFIDVTVDPATGSQTIRAVFPNPDRLLLPGMFVRAEIVEGTQTRGILIPQQAVSRNTRGEPTALIVGKNDKLQLKTLTAPRTVGSSWLVSAGLSPGDRLVVEGAQSLQPGAAVRPVPQQNGDGSRTIPTQAQRR